MGNPQKMVMQEMTRCVLVSAGGEIDATPVPNDEEGLNYLRWRADSWEWEIDEANPLVRDTATLDQLQALWRVGHEGEETEYFLDIVPILNPIWAEVKELL